MKYLLIEHADGNDPKVVTIFHTQEARETATVNAIMGASTEEDRRVCAEDIAELKENRSVTFERDPSLEWIDAEVIDGGRTMVSDH